MGSPIADVAIRVRMKHSHPDGAIPEEIGVYADSMLKKTPPLTRITKSSGTVVAYKSKRPVVKAELNYTKDGGRWQDRKWESAPANLDAKAHRASAQIPQDVKAWYINLFDDKGLVVSSDHPHLYLTF